MVHCWDEYLWKVHKAVPVDPWATDLQLLDVLIPERTCPSWLPAWLHLHKQDMPNHLARVGSMLTVAINDDSSTQQPVAKADVNTTLSQFVNNNGSRLIKESSMPDIQASIKSSTSLLASLTGGSSASAQFDVKDSKTVTCNVGSVKSRHVDLDALMELVTPPTSSWSPKISLPQLHWSSKRGQTLWVVIEIMYANKIKVEADNQMQVNAKANEGKELTLSDQVGVEKDGLWTVIAAQDNPSFPFALRLLKLKYDAGGNIVTTKSKKNLRRNNSLNNNIRLLSKKVDGLYHSLSVSHALH